MAASVPDPQPPRCGQCNYIVRGISSFTCPECGGDLREVGIDVGQRRRAGWGPAIIAAIVWGVLVLASSQMIWSAVRDGAPREATLTYSVTLGQPSSGQYEQLIVVGVEHRSVKSEAALLVNDIVSTPVVTLVRKNTTAGSLKIDLDSDTYIEVDSAGNESPKQTFLGIATLKEWLERCTGSTDTELYIEADAVARMLRSGTSQHSNVFGVGAWSSTTSGSSGAWRRSSQWNSTGSKPFGQANGVHAISVSLPIWYTVVIGLAGLVVWLVVVLRLFRYFAPPRLRA